MSCNKLKYLNSFNVAPYFRQIFVDGINYCSFFTIFFDETPNKLTQISQMDLVSRFWHIFNNQVSVRYWDSKFLGHTKADVLLAKFNDSVSALNLNKMIQISMDGPIDLLNPLKDIDWRMNSIS